MLYLLPSFGALMFTNVVAF